MASALDERYLLGVNWSTKGQAEFITIPNALPPQKLPGSFLHETSLETKTAIFREYLPGQAAEIRKGQLLLEKLKKLAPSIADRYEVKEDLLDEFQLRLVNETPVDVKLQKEGDEVISYVALSYCWNEKYVDKMEGDYGEEIMVPFNTLIFQIAIQKRIWDFEGLWIDQICINQRSTEEKSIAIPAMAALYKHARLVIVALSDIEISQEEQEFLRDLIVNFENSGKNLMSVPFRKMKPSYMSTELVLKTFWEKLLGSRWFTRAWCSHEMRLGNKQTFIIPCTPRIGNYQDTALVFSSQFLWYLCTLAGEIPSANPKQRKIRETIFEKFDILKEVEKVRRIRENKPAESEPPSTYVTQIREVMELGTGGNPGLPKDLRACDARCDKISIVLNSAGNGLNLKRGGESLKIYSSDDACYRQLLTVAIAAGDPSALCCTGQFLKTGSGNSWLCQPMTDSSHHGPSLNSFSLDRVTVDDSPSSSWIQLDGFFLRYHESPSEDCVTAAVFMTLQSQHMGLGVGPDRKTAAGPEYRYWGYHIDKGEAQFSQFTRIISSVLHCGLKWMLKTARLCGFPSNLLQEWKADATTYFYEGFNIQELMAMKWSTSDVGIRGAESVLRFSIWLMSWGVIAPEVENPTRDIWMPTIYRNESGRKVIAFSTLAISDGMGREIEMRNSELFIPECLIEDSYEKLARGWILEPKNTMAGDELTLNSLQISPREERVLGRKTRIFSDVSLLESRGEWKSVSQIRLHGPES